MSEPAHRYLVAYDIVDDRRRDHVAKVLGGYGDRLQYSVFVLDVRAARMIRLRAELMSLVKLHEDSVLICDLGPTHALSPARFDYLGRRRPITDQQTHIL